MIKRFNKGMALATVVLLVAVLGILTPLLVHWIQKEAKDTQREGKKITALHLAEVGQDRGAWKLRESDEIWTDALSGTGIPNYDGVFEFTEVDGGRYKIQVTPGPLPNAVTVLSKGLVDGTSEMRAIQAVYTRSSIVGAMSVQGGLEYKPNLRIHWGPAVTYTSIDQSPSQFYPRKYSAGQIVGRDTVNDANNGAMPSGDWVTYDYAAFFDLGNPPDIDLAQLRQRAINSSVPRLRRGSGSQAGVQAPGEGGSGRYTGDVKIEYPTSGPYAQAGDYTFSNSTSVIFIEGNLARFPNGAWLDVAALVVMGNFDFNAGGSTYTATIPSNASEEYQHSSLGGFFASQGWSDGGTWTIPDCGMHGFVYAGGDVTNAGGGAFLYGAIFVVGSVTVNTVTVYYDQNVVTHIPLFNATINRQSWDEVVTAW